MHAILLYFGCKIMVPTLVTGTDLLQESRVFMILEQVLHNPMCNAFHDLLSFFLERTAHTMSDNQACHIQLSTLF